MKYWPSGYAAKKDRRFNHPDGFPPSDQVSPLPPLLSITPPFPLGATADGATRTVGVGEKVDFVVDMPDLGGRCAVPGECVIQHWWWGKGELI